jgi:hypothetical protein
MYTWILKIILKNDTPYLKWNPKNINHAVSNVLILHHGVYINSTGIAELPMNVQSLTSNVLIMTMAQHIDFCA